MGRLGQPGDVGRVALFLGCDDSSYMTGQAVNITDGTLIRMRKK